MLPAISSSLCRHVSTTQQKILFFLLFTIPLIYCFVIYELSTSLLSKLIYILTKNSQVTVKNCFIVFKIY